MEENIILDRCMKNYGIVGFSFMKTTLKLCKLGYAMTPDDNSRKIFDSLRSVWTDKKKAPRMIGEWERSVIGFYEGRQRSVF